MVDELKRCPFCGGEAMVFVNDGVCVLCIKCRASTRTRIDTITSKTRHTNAMKSVIEAWNRRAEHG